jgi:hypothetical protein
MKKIVICISMIFILMLSACTQKDDNIKETIAQKPTKEPTQQTINKSAYESLGKAAPEDGLVLLVNNPNEKKIGLVDIGESIKLDETEEHILIIPKLENTRIEIWSLKYVEDKLVSDKLVYNNKKTPNNFVLDAKVTRAEGIPQYKMLVYTPDASAEYIFSYNGKDGNSELEYISAAK